MTGSMLRYYHTSMFLEQFTVHNPGTVSRQAAKLHCKALYKARDIVYRVILNNGFGFEYNQIYHTSIRTQFACEDVNSTKLHESQRIM